MTDPSEETTSTGQFSPVKHDIIKELFVCDWLLDNVQLSHPPKGQILAAKSKLIAQAKKGPAS